MVMVTCFAPREFTAVWGEAMTTIAPGALVTCRQTGTVLYAVVAQTGDGRWRLRGKRVDHKGRSDFTGRTAGAGDITVIREAETYEPASVIEHNGRFYEMAADNGDSVELIVPASSRPLTGGGAVRLAAGNATTVAKSDLTLETLK